MANIRLIDIANHVGVSVATVSRAMRDESPETNPVHKRVVRAADELGYFPLRDRVSSQDIGCVAMITVGIKMNGDVTSPSYDSYSSFYGRFVHGVERVVGKKGGHLTVVSLDHDQNIAGKVKKVVRTTGAQGVLLLGRFDADQVKSDCSVPTVLLNVSPGHVDAELDSVASDDIGAIVSLVKHLKSLGHERIAFLTDRGGGHHMLRLEAYRTTSTELGLDYQPIYYVEPHKECFQESMEACFKQYLQAENRPTVIICSADPFALMLLRLAHKHGINVPEELSIVGFDNIESTEHSMPALSSIDLNLEDMGREAVHLLASRLSHPEYAYRQVVVKSQLVERETIAVRV